jgi:hypothetical protein
MLALASCQHDALTTAAGDASAGASTDVSAATPDAAAPDAATPDAATPDAGPAPDDADPHDTQAQADVALADGDPTAYRRAVLDLRGVRNRRWEACFNAARARLDREDLFVGDYANALRAGRVVLDPARAAACRMRWEQATCEDLARSFVDDGDLPCPGLVQGTVPSGGLCESSDECRDPLDFCQDQDSRSCARQRCARRAGPGEPCDERACVAGLVCDDTQQPQRCLPPATPTPAAPLAPEGQPCGRDGPDCQAGSFCAPNTAVSDAGVCRAYAAGIPCRGTWQCPGPYACVPDAAGGGSHCVPGKRDGERCQIQVKNAGMGYGDYSDCAYGYACVDSGQGFTICSPGAALGAPCGDFAQIIDCGAGYCDRPQAMGRGVCRARKPAGAPCEDTFECEDPLTCAGVRGPTQRLHCLGEPSAIIPFGSLCGGDALVTCAPGLVCAPAPITSADPMSDAFTCRLPVAAGLPCDDTLACAPGNYCDGTCRACLP